MMRNRLIFKKGKGALEITHLWNRKPHLTAKRNNERRKKEQGNDGNKTKADVGDFSFWILFSNISYNYQNFFKRV